jgi:Zn finger protein HypA/HybF involved in hydrogenase expression
MDVILRTQAPTVDLIEDVPALPLELEERVEPRRHNMRCTTCRYGAAAATVPTRCPMCGGAEWDFLEWRPFSR